MALLAYSLTGSEVTLVAGNPAPTLPASGDPVNVTSELRGLTGPQYAALEAQRPGNVRYAWTDEPEYAMGVLNTELSVAHVMLTNYSTLRAHTPSQGLLATVGSNLSQWIYDSGAPTTDLMLDVEYIVSDHGGNWFRKKVASPTPTKASPHLYYVDAQNGNDETGIGTAAEPFKTCTEFMIRTGGYLQTLATAVYPTQIWLSSELYLISTTDWPIEDRLVGRLLFQPHVVDGAVNVQPSLTIYGVAPVLATGTVTSYTARNYATNAPGVINDAAMDWAPHVGKHIRIDNPVVPGHWALGNINVIAEDMGANSARVGPSWYWQDPVPGDTYVIHDTLKVPLIDLTSSSNEAFLWIVGIDAVNVRMGNIIFHGSTIIKPTNAFSYGIQGDEVGTQFCFIDGNGEAYAPCGTPPQYWDAGSVIKNVKFSRPTNYFAGYDDLYDSMLYGGSLNYSGFGSSLRLSYCGFFGTSVATTHVTIQQGATLRVASNVWGNLTATRFLDITSGGSAVVSTTLAQFTVVVSGGLHVRLDGINAHIPPLTPSAAVPATSTITTFTQWNNAPFSRFCVTQRGSKIIGT